MFQYNNIMSADLCATTTSTKYKMHAWKHDKTWAVAES